MFTGLVAQKGALLRRAASPAGARLEIGVGDSPEMALLVLGESVAVNGCCLTVAAKTARGFEADASPETLAKTTLGELPEGAALNLERALKVGDRLGGHMVSGHVDGVGSVIAREPQGDALVLRFAVPAELARFIAVKGSIIIDGVSLTVNTVGAAGSAGDGRSNLGVMLIPVTREKTSLDALTVGARVNVEVDLVARYVAQLLDARADARD